MFTEFDELLEEFTNERVKIHGCKRRTARGSVKLFVVHYFSLEFYQVMP